MEAIKEIERGYPLFGASVPKGHLYADEYSALTSQIPNLSETEDLVTRHHTEQWRNVVSEGPSAVDRVVRAVDQLVAVERIKEIMVFKGFQRLDGGDDSHVVPPDLSGETDWLPALELFGEGIFFTLSDAALSAWEGDSDVAGRAMGVQRQLVSAPRRSTRGVYASPRFLLLHALAHLVIRQLATTVGYPAAALKERIYCGDSSQGGQGPMAGILIYVAVPDTAGSLGGLVEQAEPERFRRVLSAAVEASTWCSLDPVCSEQQGHGPGLLNAAACHACLFVPEPSCQWGNAFLDRAFVTGIRSLGLRGFFHPGNRQSEGNRWRPEKAQRRLRGDDGPNNVAAGRGGKRRDSATWTNALLHAATEVQADLQQLSERDIPAPEVGFELIGGPNGTVLGEAELAWPAHNLAVLMDNRSDDQGVFESHGWRVLVAPATGLAGTISNLVAGG